MLLLILGILLWCAGHLWKRLAPDARAGFGDKGKMIAAAAMPTMYAGMMTAELVEEPMIQKQSRPMR